MEAQFRRSLGFMATRKHLILKFSLYFSILKSLFGKEVERTMRLSVVRILMVRSAISMEA